MSDAGIPVAAPAAPAPSAPASPGGAATTGGTPAPGGNAARGTPPGPGAVPSTAFREQHAAPGAGASAPRGTDPAAATDPAREGTERRQRRELEPHLWRTRVGEAEHEIDIAPALAEYRRKLKVDGEEVEVGIDDLAKSYERVRSSMRRFEDASKAKKDADAKLERVTNVVRALQDPRQTLSVARRVLGEEAFREGVAQYLRDVANYEQLTPEQRAAHDQAQRRQQEIRQQETTLERREREIREREQRLVAEERQRLVAQYEQTWPPILKAAGVPATRRTIALMAQELRRAAEAGAPITEQEAAQLVRDEVRELVRSMGGDPAQLRELVGEEAAEKLRQAEVARLQEQPGRRQLGGAAPAGAPPPRQQEARTWSEYRAMLRAQDEAAAERRRRGG